MSFQLDYIWQYNKDIIKIKSGRWMLQIMQRYRLRYCYKLIHMFKNAYTTLHNTDVSLFFVTFYKWVMLLFFVQNHS